MFINVNSHPGSQPKALGGLGQLSRARVILSEFKYDRGSEIYGQAEPADYIYQVVDGAARSHKLLSDGRRQIGAFHLPGDIFGLENSAVHRFTAEAIVDTTVRLMKRCSLEHVAESDALVALDLLNMTTTNLQHAEDHMLLLGRKTSLERVAAFLLEMDRRLTAAGVFGPSDEPPRYRRLSRTYARDSIPGAITPPWQGYPQLSRSDSAANRAARPRSVGGYGSLAQGASLHIPAVSLPGHAPKTAVPLLPSQPMLSPNAIRVADKVGGIHSARYMLLLPEVPAKPAKLQVACHGDPGRRAFPGRVTWLPQLQLAHGWL